MYGANPVEINFGVVRDVNWIQVLVLTYIFTAALFAFSFFFFSSLLGQRKFFGKGKEPETPERT